LWLCELQQGSGAACGRIISEVQHLGVAFGFPVSVVSPHNEIVGLVVVFNEELK